MLWMIIVLVPKGNSGDFQGIGLLEVILKVIEWMLDERISVIPVHGALHGSQAKRVYGTGIVETKLAQQLTFLEQLGVCPNL